MFLSIVARSFHKVVFIWFRHAHASILIHSGVDIATVSADLGHSSSNTTLGIYTHEFQEAQARTSDIIAEAMNLGNKKEPAVS